MPICIPAAKDLMHFWHERKTSGGRSKVLLSLTRQLWVTHPTGSAVFAGLTITTDKQTDRQIKLLIELRFYNPLDTK